MFSPCAESSNKKDKKRNTKGGGEVLSRKDKKHKLKEMFFPCAELYDTNDETRN